MRVSSAGGASSEEGRRVARAGRWEGAGAPSTLTTEIVPENVTRFGTCIPQAPKPATQAPKATTASATKAAPKATAAPAAKAAAKPRAAAPKPEPSSGSPSKVVRVKKEYALPGQTRDTPEEVRLDLVRELGGLSHLCWARRVGLRLLLICTINLGLCVS